MNLFYLSLFLPMVSSSPVDKCGGMLNSFPGFEDLGDQPVVIVNATVLPASDGLGTISSLDVERIELTCWNPETGEIGIAPAISLVRVYTKDAFPDIRSPALEAVARQRTSKEEQGAFASSLEELDLQLPEGVTAEMREEVDGWELTLESRFQVCTVDQSVVATTTYELEGAKRCFLKAEEQEAALRSAHNGGGG